MGVYLYILKNSKIFIYQKKVILSKSFSKVVFEMITNIEETLHKRINISVIFVINISAILLKGVIFQMKNIIAIYVSVIEIITAEILKSEHLIILQKANSKEICRLVSVMSALSLYFCWQKLLILPDSKLTIAIEHIFIPEIIKDCDDIIDCFDCIEDNCKSYLNHESISVN